MTLRIGFDLDGTLADFATAFRAVEVKLLGDGPSAKPADPEIEAQVDERTALPGSSAGARAPGHVDSRREARRRQDVIWAAIRAEPDFWETLQPIDSGAVARLQALSVRYRWEVFFITQRPDTAGDTVQRQTQRWLRAHGFDLPSVLVLGSGRGAAAGALRLDYHVDDSSRHCVDVLCDSKAKPLLIVAESDIVSAKSARILGVGTVPTVGAALDVLEEASIAVNQPGVLARLAALVGWRERQ